MAFLRSVARCNSFVSKKLHLRSSAEINAKFSRSDLLASHRYYNELKRELNTRFNSSIASATSGHKPQQKPIPNEKGVSPKDPLDLSFNNSAVLIELKEDFGTLGRAGYFDKAGIIRDVIQNHLLQVLTLIAMEKPISTKADDIRNEKVKVLKTVPAIELEDVILGQYVGNPDGKTEDERTGYLEDETLKDKNSTTSTNAITTLHIENERWKGVPFFLRCGKGLNDHRAEVRIQFKRVSDDIFHGQTQMNELVIRLYPNEAIRFFINLKQPGFNDTLHATELNLIYKNSFPEAQIPESYERLIGEVLDGSQVNFVRTDELSEAWRIFTPLLHQIEKQRAKPYSYVFGSRGPIEADKFFTSHGFESDADFAWDKP